MQAAESRLSAKRLALVASLLRLAVSPTEKEPGPLRDPAPAVLRQLITGRR